MEEIKIVSGRTWVPFQNRDYIQSSNKLEVFNEIMIKRLPEYYSENLKPWGDFDNKTTSATYKQFFNNSSEDIVCKFELDLREKSEYNGFEPRSYESLKDIATGIFIKAKLNSISINYDENKTMRSYIENKTLERLNKVTLMDSEESIAFEIVCDTLLLNTTIKETMDKKISDFITSYHPNGKRGSLEVNIFDPTQERINASISSYVAFTDYIKKNQDAIFGAANLIYMRSKMIRNLKNFTENTNPNLICINSLENSLFEMYSGADKIVREMEPHSSGLEKFIFPKYYS